MAVRPIRITGDPVLHSVAETVVNIDESVRQLVNDLEETMAAAPGVGLAAPQVGVQLRVFVYSWVDDDGVVHRGTAINPELLVTPTELGDLDEDDESEGCLSIPGERFPLRRSVDAVLTATDLDGKRYEVRASGWLARIFQHEFDHLNGILYSDRLVHPHDKDMAKAVRKQSWGSPGQSWTPGIDHLEG
ncbi:MAG: peptide deformylase [Pseudolysinimonas sp.]